MLAFFTTRLEGAGRERGMTIIEVLVASVVLALGALATFGTLSAATKNNQRAKSSQVALDKAQQELEAMRGLENKQLALTAAPPGSSKPLSPDYRVTGGTFATVREPPSSYATLVVNGGSLYGGGFVEGGVINPGPTSFTSGDVSGKVYRYVVWRDDTSCPASTCPGLQDFKQIVVAVKLDTPGNQAGERGYVEVGSDFIDPSDNSLHDPIPGANGVVTAQQFFLSDTPCAASGKTVRQEILGDHLLHNTRGTCASGLKTGSTEVGAPDALLLGSPPDPDPADESNPGLYDYASDPYLEPTPNTDKGLQIRPDDTNGCHYNPTGTTHPESQVHRWVTDPVPSTLTEGFKMTGNVTLEFYSKTLNKASHTGTLCVYLFKRHETGSPPVATDTLLTNLTGGAAYWTYTPKANEFWPPGIPTEEWKKLRLTMSFNGAPYTIPVGDRLGVALSLERFNTPAEAIQFMYDHPNYPSRIEVETNTPIDGG
jgi:prepilin-type N-terminal cleavage/methylation domain-containing protein